MDGRHKFKHLVNEASKYGAVIYCEYCGLVAYDSNRDALRDKGQKMGAKPCPRNIDTALIEGEL